MPVFNQQQLDQLLNQGQITQQQYMQGVQALQASGGLGLAPAPAAPAAPAQGASPPPVLQVGDVPPIVAPAPPPAFQPNLGSYMRMQGGQPQAPPPPPPAAPPPAPPAPPPKALSAPPAASGASAPAQPGIDPALAAQLAGVGPAAQMRPVGLSPADKEEMTKRAELEEKRQREASTAIQLAADNAATVKEQSGALADDLTIGKLRAAHDAKADADRMDEIRRDAKDAHTRIQAQIADMQAQGVDPNKYWKDQSTIGKLGLAFAIGLGAAGAQLGHGGQNAALQIVEGAVNREIDAQKTNLQKNMQLLQMKAQANGQNFDMETALAKAERESHQAAYNVVLADVDRRKALLGDNTQAQAQFQQFRQSIAAKADEGLEGKIKDEYAVRKRAEQLVPVAGAGGIDRKAILESAADYIKRYAEKGLTLPREAAQRMAYEDKTGRPGGAGGFATVPALPSGPGAGKLSPRIATRLAEYDSLEKEGQELLGLMDKGSRLNPNDRARAEAIAQRFQEAGFASMPKAPLGISTALDFGNKARIAQTIESVRNQRKTLEARGPTAGAEEKEQPEKDE